MPSLKSQPIKLALTNKMLYDSVDNYHPLGMEDNSLRMNNHEDLNDFSSQSIVCAMDRFVKAVNNMNETIMVPCRLLDIEASSQKSSSKLPKLLKAGGDPYTYYSVLNSVKNDLIWGASSNDDDATTDNSSLTPSINNTRWTGQESNSTLTKKQQQPLRRESTLSLASMSSNTSEGESETGCESTEEDEGSNVSEEGSSRSVSTVNNVTETMRMHLFGLHTCLKNLTDTATYITDCYQEMVNI